MAFQAQLLACGLLTPHFKTLERVNLCFLNAAPKWFAAPYRFPAKHKAREHKQHIQKAATTLKLQLEVPLVR